MNNELNYRKALKKAFKLLKCDNGISFIDFLCCMQQFRPQTSEWIPAIQCVIK